MIRRASSRSISRSGPNGPRPGRAIENRREIAYRQLKTEIVDGRMRPGEPLAEVELSDRIGVSRTPIREALQRLAMEGLVTWVPGRGAFVSAVSVPEIVELFQLREALETHAARLAARSPRHASLAVFLERLESARDTLATGDARMYNELTAALDKAVVDLAGNKRIATALAEIWTQVLRVRRIAYSNMTRIVDSVDEHARIVGAVSAGDEEAAAAAAAQHIRRSLENVIESFARGSLGASE